MKIINRLIIIAFTPLLKLTLRFNLKPERRAEVEQTLAEIAAKGIDTPEPEELLFAALLLAGAVLRINGLGSSAWWFDESYSMTWARMPSILTGVQIEVGQFNNPLWHLIAWVFVHLFGQSEVAIRLPSLLAGIGSLLIGWWIIQQLTQNTAARISALAWVALIPYSFWLSQDARCYSIYSMLYLAGFAFGLKRQYMGLAACFGLLLYIHPTALFYCAALGLSILVLHWKDRAQIVLSGAVALVSYIPWIPVLTQIPKFWNGPLTAEKLMGSLNFGIFANTINNQVIILIVILLIPASILYGLWNMRRSKQLYLAIFALGPLLLMIAAAPHSNVIFYRTISAAMFPLGIWLAIAITPTGMSRRWIINIAWGLLIIIGVIGWNPQSRGAELRDLARQISARWQPGDVLYHNTGLSYQPFELYLPGKPAYLLDAELPTSGLQSRPLEKLLGFQEIALEQIPHKRAWILYAHDWQLPDYANARMDAYIRGAVWIGTVHTVQVAPIDVYLQESNDATSQ